MGLNDTYPAIIGATYTAKRRLYKAYTSDLTVSDWPEVVLESFDLKEDKIRLKSVISPQVFESSYATFCYCWKLKSKEHS